MKIRAMIKKLILKFKKLALLLENKGFKNTIISLYYSYLKRSYPTSIQIEITTKCNLDCIICLHSYVKVPIMDMPFEKFKFIVDNYYNLRTVHLTGLGENFLNKDVLKMIKYAKFLKIFIFFFDNFYLINEDIAKQLIDIGVDEIYASIDGATKKTYEKIRRGSNFERVISNVKNFIRIREEKNAYLPQICFHYVINKYNYNEIFQYIEMIHSLVGNTKTKIRFTVLMGEKFEPFRNLCLTEGLSEDIIQKIIEKGKKFGIPIIFSSNVLKIKPSITKCTKKNMPFVTVTGKVVPCCLSHHPLEEYHLGNIFKQSFKEIWHGGKYKAFRDALKRGETPFYCRYCSYYDINKN